MSTITRTEWYQIASDFYGALNHLSIQTSYRRHIYADDLRNIGDPFFHDYRAILSSKAHRRQCHKNQVALCDSIMVHLRNRSTHVAEVTALAALIADSWT